MGVVDGVSGVAAASAGRRYDRRAPGSGPRLIGPLWSTVTVPNEPQQEATQRENDDGENDDNDDGGRK